MWPWIRTVLIMGTVFFLTFGGFNLYLLHNLVKVHGKVAGIGLWKQWKL